MGVDNSKKAEQTLVFASIELLREKVNELIKKEKGDDEYKNVCNNINNS